MKSKKGKTWTKSDVNLLKKLARKGETTENMARKLGRTIYAVYNKAGKEKKSLMPKDK